MALPTHIALVPFDVKVDPAELMAVAAGLSRQVQRDFGPIWGVDATVDPFLKVEAIPLDSWPIFLMKDVKDAAGFHQDQNGQPFAQVEFGKNWSVTASHECLEMLADPFGSRMRSAELLDQAIELGGIPGKVQYLVEVCDPSEAGDFGYQINGIPVSDFYTPQYFDPVQLPDRRYSFTNSIKKPRLVLEDGYLSWFDPRTGDWMQLRMFPDEISEDVPHLVNLSKQTQFNQLLEGGTSPRSAVDTVTRSPALTARLPTDLVAKKESWAKVAQQARAVGLTSALNRIQGES